MRQQSRKIETLMSLLCDGFCHPLSGIPHGRKRGKDGTMGKIERKKDSEGVMGRKIRGLEKDATNVPITIYTICIFCVYIDRYNVHSIIYRHVGTQVQMLDQMH